ncbi:hypothetical protein VTN02DRAFT_2430 [Thermoascus thermophilus]
MAARRWPAWPLGRIRPPCVPLAESPASILIRTHNTRRSFHSTPPHPAVRRPVPASRLPRVKVQQPQGLAELSEVPDESGIEQLQADLDELGGAIYSSAKAAGILGDITYERFMYLAKRLIYEARSGPPTKHAALRVSKDLDTVWYVSMTLGILVEEISDWAFVATTQAGAREPIILGVSNTLKQITIPPRTAMFNRVEELAIEEQDPRAMVVHAKVLSQRGQYMEALDLLEEVMPRIYPTKIQPPMGEDITLKGRIEPPWKLYAWLKEKVGDRKATDETLKMAALEYQDPEALLTYAHIMKQEGNMEMYEECLNKAATAGNPEACRKLANFYYLNYHGRFPLPGEGEGEEGKSNQSFLHRKISALFGQSRTRDDYRKLALEWYELAFNHGSRKAALILSMLLREDGHSEVGKQYLEVAESERKFLPFVKRLKENWDSKEFDVKIPMQLLDT